VLIGKIVGVHGIQGTCKMRSFAESLNLFETGSTILVLASDGRQKIHEVNWVKSHTKVDLISFKGVDHRDQAEMLIGSELYIEKNRLAELEDGSYYWFDLIGMDVFTVDGKHIGRLVSIIQTGSNDVYVVKDDANEILIPALASIVQNIDLDKKRMLVDLPEGL
jgi:16S rRNA processing protein RimM